MEIDKQKFNQFKKMIDNYKSIPAYFLSDQSDQYINYYKNGHKIHIKEENKGKFTSYCNGKVTNECIQQGKNSSSPTIRKRATFAANARKWHH